MCLFGASLLIQNSIQSGQKIIEKLLEVEILSALWKFFLKIAYYCDYVKSTLKVESFAGRKFRGD